MYRTRSLKGEHSLPLFYSAPVDRMDSGCSHTIAKAGEKSSICSVPYFMPIVTLCLAKTFGNPWGSLNRPLPNGRNPRAAEV
jgi:hypothetical protein